MNDCNLSGGDAVLRVKALEQQVAALEAEKVGRQQAVPSGLSEALRQYRHNDGSDGFVFGYDKGMTDRYVAGLAQGGAADLERIRHLVDLATDAHFREMESRTAGLVEALEEIVSPVTFMKKRLKSDERLEGFYAQQLSSDPNYLKQIAARALAALATFHREG